jgi:hypothetical protein
VGDALLATGAEQPLQPLLSCPALPPVCKPPARPARLLRLSTTSPRRFMTLPGAALESLHQCRQTARYECLT